MARWLQWIIPVVGTLDLLDFERVSQEYAWAGFEFSRKIKLMTSILFIINQSIS